MSKVDQLLDDLLYEIAEVYVGEGFHGSKYHYQWMDREKAKAMILKAVTDEYFLPRRGHGNRKEAGST